MIEVSELAGAVEPKAGRQLNELLLSHIGKVIRIRSISIQTIDLHHEEADSIRADALFSLEMAGTLLLVDFSDLRIQGHAIRGGDTLSITLAGSEGPRPLDLEDSVLQIQAVTSETSGWRVIHQSPDWDSIERQGEASAQEDDQ